MNILFYQKYFELMNSIFETAKSDYQQAQNIKILLELLHQVMLCLS